MSYYNAYETLYGWATSHGGLYRHISPGDYPQLFEAIERRKLNRIGVGLLKVLYEKHTGAPKDDPRASMSLAVTKEELRAILHCSSSAVRKNANRINDLVRRGARLGTFARQFGLIWRNEFGIGIHMGLVDGQSARRMSEVHITKIPEAARNNLAVVAEAEGEQALSKDLRCKFDALSPAQQARVLAVAGGMA